MNNFSQVNPGLLANYMIFASVFLLIIDVIVCLTQLFFRRDAMYKNEKSKVIVNSIVLLISIILILMSFRICNDEVLSVLFGIPHFIISGVFSFMILWGLVQMKSVSESAMQILENLVGVIEAGDENLDGHSIHVQNLTMLIYDYLPFSYRARINPVNLEYASLLLDIGKLGIPRNIIDKRGKLLPNEKELVQRHPEICVEIFHAIPSLKTVTYWVKYHHERIDGKGYFHLKGKEIPLASRILALADTYSAITMDRSYRASLPYENAITELKMVAGTQLDSELVEIFCSIPRMKVTECINDVRKRMKKYQSGDFRW